MEVIISNKLERKKSVRFLALSTQKISKSLIKREIYIYLHIIIQGTYTQQGPFFLVNNNNNDKVVIQYDKNNVFRFW